MGGCNGHAGQLGQVGGRSPVDLGHRVGVVPQRRRPALRRAQAALWCSAVDALAVASCREVIVETASTRGARPKLHAALAALKPGDTLVICKPDRIARSMKEPLVLLEDELHARQVNLEILTGFHRPNGQTITDKMLFMVAAMAAETERDLIQERTLDGLAVAAAQGRRVRGRISLSVIRSSRCQCSGQSPAREHSSARLRSTRRPRGSDRSGSYRAQRRATSALGEGGRAPQCVTSSTPKT